MKKRTLSAMLLLAALLMSCSNAGPSSTDETTPAAVSENTPAEAEAQTEETTDGRELYAPELPARN